MVKRDENKEPVSREVQGSFLEYWMNYHNISGEVYEADFIDYTQNQINNLQTKLRLNNLYLTFINGQKGYFCNKELYELIVNGDAERNIKPIYKSGDESVHHTSAYGSLILSDGNQAIQIEEIKNKKNSNKSPIQIQTEIIQQKESKDVKVLVVNDEAENLEQFLGKETYELFERIKSGLNEEERSKLEKNLEILFDKMGDGTLLIRPTYITELIKEKRDKNAIHKNKVYQFRAGTIEESGIIKGTLQSSYLCAYLGVDLIISSNCIKGDDGSLSKSGLKEYRSFWINRKMESGFGLQAVGPQVKGAIPESTRLEINPKIEDKAEELIHISFDPLKIAERYTQEIEEKDKEEDYIYTILKNDRFKIMHRSDRINKKLQEYVTGQWKYLAIHGIQIPYAMAQSHREIQPWEVYNPKLPHGAIVMYYRSPFPSISAATIGINNLESLPKRDFEATLKQGVAYLNPWTAKNIAITDFDGDINAFFVGYYTINPNITNILRNTIKNIEILTEEDRRKLEIDLGIQSEKIDEIIKKTKEFKNSGKEKEEVEYEAFRLISEAMIQAEKSLIKAEFPQVINETILLTSPEEKPPAIQKAKKMKFLRKGKDHDSRMWEVWRDIAQNDIGIIANIKINLDALANECIYIQEKGEKQSIELYQIIRNHFKNLLEKHASEIPSDKYLQNINLPLQGIQRKIEEIINIDDAYNFEKVSQKLNLTRQFLLEISNTIVADNLQVAVDGQKSARKVDQLTNHFSKIIQYKIASFISEKNKEGLYKRNEIVIKTNTVEPISENIERINDKFKATALAINHETLINGIISKYVQAQEINIKGTDKNKIKEIIDKYFSKMSRVGLLNDPLLLADESLLRCTINIEGKEIIIYLKENQTLLQQKEIEKMVASDEVLDIKNGSKDKKIIFIEDKQGNDKQNTQANDKERIRIRIGNADGKIIGLTELSQEETNELKRYINGNIYINNYSIKIDSYINKRNEIINLVEQSEKILDDFSREIKDDKETRKYMASALGSQASGLFIALKKFPEEVIEIINEYNKICVIGTQFRDEKLKNIQEGQYEIRFGEYNFIDKKGEVSYRPSIQIMVNNEFYHYGITEKESIKMPYGSRVIGTLKNNGKNSSIIEIDKIIEYGQGLYPSEILRVNSELNRQIEESTVQIQNNNVEYKNPLKVTIMNIENEEEDIVFFQKATDDIHTINLREKNCTSEVEKCTLILRELRNQLQGEEKYVEVNLGSRFLLRGLVEGEDCGDREYEKEIKSFMDELEQLREEYQIKFRFEDDLKTYEVIDHYKMTKVRRGQGVKESQEDRNYYPSLGELRELYINIRELSQTVVREQEKNQLLDLLKKIETLGRNLKTEYQSSSKEINESEYKSRNIYLNTSEYQFMTDLLGRGQSKKASKRLLGEINR